MSAEVGPAVLSVRRYEAGPPPNMALQVDAGDTYATTKEEEWVTKKKTELTTTRQIETRVKRQVVLEDGHVVEDSGPVVTTNTTEDTQKQEQKSTEHRTTGDDPPGPDWVAVVTPGQGLVKEVVEKTVKTRDEKEDRIETEDVHHLGDLSDDTYQAAITSGQDLREALGRELVASSGPRIVHQSRKGRHVVDTADSTALSQVQADGRIVTETRRTTEHDEQNDEEVPDENEDGLSHSDEEVTKKESSHRYAKTKDQDLVEYISNGVKVGEEMRYNAENTEGERTGDPADMALHQQEWDSLSTRIRRMRRQTNRASVTPPRGIPAAGATPGVAGATVPLDRKDALTKKPLDFDQEEETRKVETSKWLTHHFGSESSRDSMDEDDVPAAGNSTSFINVTMQSRPIQGRVTSPVNGGAGRQAEAAFCGTDRLNSTAAINRGDATTFNGTANNTRFTRISSPVNGDGVSPTFVTNARSSGLSSPVNGFPRNGLNSTAANGHTKSSNVSSPVYSNSTPKSYMATVNSSSRVYVSSPESEEPIRSPNAANGFFQGVSDWTERRNEHQVQETRQTFTPPPLKLTHPERVQVLPSGPSHTFATSPYNSNSNLDRTTFSSPTSRNSPYHSGNLISSERRTQQNLERSSPLHNTTHNSSRQDLNQSSYMNASRQELYQNSSSRQDLRSSPYPARDSPGLNGDRAGSPARTRVSSSQMVNGTTYREQRELRGASPTHGRNMNGWAEHEDDGYRGYRIASQQQQEPDPDYSPPQAKEYYDRDSPLAGSKKHYQRTRFAADIPPPPASPPNRPATRSKSPGNIIGDSFRKLVGKFRSRSSERKNKRNSTKTSSSKTPSSRSPSPRQSHTYQQYNVIDNNIPPASASLMTTSGGAGRVGRRDGGGTGGGETEEQQQQEQPVPPPRSARASGGNQKPDMERRGPAQVQRYYLGEDPFGGSIYGREKEYDGVTPVKRRNQHRQQNGHRRGSNEEDDMNRANMNHHVTNASTLGRLSKSTSRLVGAGPDYSRTSQTLPRKLQHHSVTTSTTSSVATPTGINVSIVNNVTPAKPARTYRSNLSRSQSFNVQPLGGRSGVYTSNPSLNRIGESQEPLKSPAILASISRSQKDLTAPIEEEDPPPRFTKTSSNIRNGSPTDHKKEIFMQGLMDRAPELFKTLHGDDIALLHSSGLAPSPPGRLYTSTPLRQTVITESTETSSTKTTPLRNGYTSYNSSSASTPLRNGLIMDSTHSTGSSPMRSSRVVESFTTNINGGTSTPSRNRLNGTPPLRNGGGGRVVESSHSFRSSSTNDSDPVRHLSSPYRQPADRVGSPSLYAATQGRVNSPSLYAASQASLKGDRVNSPSPGFSTSLTHSLENGMATSRSVERRGSGDDYSETVRIQSKNDDPIRPSETNTVKSFSKKIIPSRDGSGRATAETVKSSETTTVTKSRFRGVNGGLEHATGAIGPTTAAYTNRNGGVIIEVRPGRK